ncbi:putative ribonuclease H-like domain-containing protein [Tanacetum coccineum]
MELQLLSWVSDCEEEDVPQAKKEKKTVKSSFAKIEFVKSKEPKVVNTAKPKAVLNAVKGNQVNAVKALACWVWKPKTKVLDHGNPQMDLQDQGVIDSGFSRHMTGNMSYLTDFEEINGGYVAFGGNPKGGKTQQMYNKNGGLTCLFAKATSDESKLWHRRLGHINFKTMNKLVKGNLVRGLPSKLFENDQTCVSCQKGKQHRASYDYNRFSWVLFLATKDETSGILKSVITGVENLIDQRVKVIRKWTRLKLFDINALKVNEFKHSCCRKSALNVVLLIYQTLKVPRVLLKMDFKPLGDNEKKVTKEPGKEGGDPTSPTLSLFHDDPYMKVMHAYYAKESPIPPPTIVPPSSMLSPMEQIEEILNHLDELSLDRIEHIEDKIEGLRNGQKEKGKENNKNCSGLASEIANLEQIIKDIQQPAMTQAAIRKLIADSVTAALEAQVATMKNADNTNRNIEERGKCSYKEFISCQPINFKDCKVKFATGTLTEEALSWWNYFSQPIRIEEAYKITWVESKKLLIKKYCPRTEVQKMETNFTHGGVSGITDCEGNDLTNVERFH